VSGQLGPGGVVGGDEEGPVPGPGKASPGETPPELLEELAVLFADHYRDAVRYASWLTGDLDLSHDLATDGCLRVWDRMSAGHHVRDVGPYLRRTIYRLFVDHVRVHRRLVLVEHQLDQAGLDQAAAPGRCLPADPTEGWASLHDLRAAMSRLSVRHQLALRFAAHGATSAELAAGLGLPTAGAAAVVLHRARKALRTALSTPPPPALA
jgi:RNA polymerase sigma factor (sigma-70 family)